MSDVAVTLVVDNDAQSSSIEDNTKDIRDITTTIQQISVTSSKRAENAKDIQKFVADGDEKINATAVKNLGIAAAEAGAGIVHVSTDYVFDGSSCKPYSEDMPTKPCSVYGKTKLLGELDTTNVS